MQSYNEMMDTFRNTAYFLCQQEDLINRISNIDPIEYGKTRNYLDGSVTWLSPFITHGIIGTADIAKAIQHNHAAKDCHKLLFELAWREYFHRVWEANGNAIYSDMRNPSPSNNSELPEAILRASTGIDAVDQTLQNLMSVGTMHNHARMWVAALCCNTADTHWLSAAKWMHYHLLDGDLASNTLSWQWVAGTFSNKRYIANQDNINKYSKTTQHGTFLDKSYEELAQHTVPDELARTMSPVMAQSLPGERVTELAEMSGTVALRSVWQLNHNWQQSADHQVLFIEQSLHSQWPMSEKRWQFILHWANLIPNLKIVNGTVEELNTALKNATITRQAYPACTNWPGTVETRPWLYQNPEKPYKSFSQFWKQVQHGDG